jgi:class 3 adenylate cyclase
METNYIAYDYLKSFGRMDEILAAADVSHQESDTIPARSDLTFTNGFYVNCSALFADIRGSSELTQKYKRPTLAKIYRAYISEVVAVLNGSLDCKEVVITGDCVSGIFSTPYKSDIDAVFAAGYTINSVVKTLNYKLTKRGIEAITVGIGMDYGRALMAKAGYSGSKINDVVWMGDVVNAACKLGNYANSTYADKPIMVGSVFHQNLNDENRAFLSYNATRGCYHGNVVRTDMEKWFEENCE